ncbi:4-hydroxybenzoate octaprenyltransferase [Fluviibacterium sp. DFM31]|uniref:4-hydroxybenzoate octaprenyltransferase n=1 Tax=Meridianimarinicoccus marinus TaxID=3231483 RepID=A0ABV3L6K5_9RHOB
MTDSPQAPEGQVSDAVRGNWVDHRAPDWARPYLRLSRADRPVGTWLLLLPCWWGVLLSAASGDGLGWRGLWIMLGCGLGAWLMRGAGCTWNDITDREFDAAVARTQSRPIPSGQVSVRGAVVWMGLQALLAFAILLTFNLNAILLGVASLALVAIYPFAKRFTWWPQVFLGLAFNWGALLAWTAHDGRLGWPAVLLYLSGLVWTLFYDTIYAHQDKEDDALIGVKSTARLFGSNTHRWLTLFLWGSVALMALAIWVALAGQGLTMASAVAFLAVPGFAVHQLWQLRRLQTEDPDTCLWLFRSNRDTGLIPAAAFALALLL